MTPIPNKRYLIVNGDDFGLSEGVNRGVLWSHDHGILTSASLMVRQPAAASAAEEAIRRPRLSVGLHLNLGEWVYRDGSWMTLYEVVPLDDVAAVEAELSRQVERFVQLLGRPPTHLDSHQHLHRSDPLRTVALALAARLNVPLRHFSPAVSYCGAFYGQDGRGEPLPELITPDALANVIRSLPCGVTELACHPSQDSALQSAYREERIAEVAALCDPLVRTVIAEQQVELISFLSLPIVLSSPSPR
jgi:chitin disaccharide deacetylase